MSDFEEEYRAKGVEFLTINAFEPFEKGKAWAEESGLHFTWLRAEREALEAMGVKGVPTQILLDRDGKVLWTSSFSSIAGGADAIRQALDDAL